MVDQAYVLRELMKKENAAPVGQNVGMDKLVKVYSIVSGKGGVGKTNIAVNLAIACSQQGKRVLIIDADIGMTNADILMGINYEYDLFDNLEGKKDLRDIIYEGPAGIKIISGGSGLMEVSKLDETSQRTFIEELVGLGEFDIIIIDNGAGISREMLSFITFSHEVILVSTPEPTAIADAYRVLKAIAAYDLKDNVNVVINRIGDMSAGDEAYRKLSRTAEKFLNLRLENIGYVFDDVRLEKSVLELIPLLIRFPDALSSRNIYAICDRMLSGKFFNRNISNMKQLGNRFMKIFG